MVSSTPRPHFNPGKHPVPILQEAGWAQRPVWTGGKSRLHRDWNPDRPARRSVAMPTELPGPQPPLCGIEKLCESLEVREDKPQIRTAIQASFRLRARLCGVLHTNVCQRNGHDIKTRIQELQNTVIPRLTSDPANEFFG